MSRDGQTDVMFPINFLKEIAIYSLIETCVHIGKLPSYNGSTYIGDRSKLLVYFNIFILQ